MVVGVDGFEGQSRRADTLLNSADQRSSNKSSQYRLNRHATGEHCDNSHKQVSKWIVKFGLIGQI